LKVTTLTYSNSLLGCADISMVAGSQIGGKTSFPIMFIGNTADTVTPLVGAKRMSKLFRNSVTKV
jgi:hypothetical protein